ncbi:helix-turn-helix domain-containing protein [Streptomyces sp. NPDC001231]|uniref:helix-turn-helix domain-containing protein n=1 Tax=Streptomyces sp. NPDC001231 TaxID=3364549 RepID=UPI00369CB09A
MHSMAVARSQWFRRIGYHWLGPRSESSHPPRRGPAAAGRQAGCPPARSPGFLLTSARQGDPSPSPRWCWGVGCIPRLRSSHWVSGWGGLTAAGRQRQEAVLMQAAELFEQKFKPPEVARRLRVSRKSAYQWYQRARQTQSGQLRRCRTRPPGDARP